MRGRSNRTGRIVSANDGTRTAIRVSGPFDRDRLHMAGGTPPPSAGAGTTQTELSGLGTLRVSHNRPALGDVVLGIA